MTNYEKREFITRLVMLVCMTALLLSLLLLLGCQIFNLIKIMSQENSDFELSGTYSISSITVDSQGCFVLEQDHNTDLGDYYVFYTVSDDGGEKRSECSVEYTTIYRTLSDGDTPYLECLKNRAGDKQYKMYLPEDAVIQER